MLIENDVIFAYMNERDRIIISMDNAYDSIPNLNRYEPDEIS